MSLNKRKEIRNVQRRGNSLCVILPKHVVATLGWNLGDAVTYTIVQGQLVVTRLTMPKVTLLKVDADARQS